MTIAGCTVIDCHHHVGSLEAQGFVFADVDAGQDPATVELERRLSAMERQGVDQAIVIPGHGYLRPDGVADTRRINDGVAAYRDGKARAEALAVEKLGPLAGGLGGLSGPQGEIGPGGGPGPQLGF